MEISDFAEARREDVRKHASKPDPTECNKRNIKGYNLEQKKKSGFCVDLHGGSNFANNPQANPELKLKMPAWENNCKGQESQQQNYEHYQHLQRHILPSRFSKQGHISCSDTKWHKQK